MRWTFIKYIIFILDSTVNTRSSPDTSESESSGGVYHIPLTFNFGRNLKNEDFARRKRTPQEPSSLQSLLANHRIDTNVLKTRAQLRQPGPLSQILTPQRSAR